MSTALVIYLGTIVAMALIVGASALFQFRPTRTCDLCGEKVSVERKDCRVCGYRFDDIRGVNL